MKKFLLFFLFLAAGRSIISQTRIFNIDGVYYDVKGNVFSGHYKEYDGKGTLVLEIPVKDGLLEGQVIYYYPNGKMKELRTYSQGILNGVWMEWDEEGNKIAEASYSMGLKDGKWYIWDKKGNLRIDMTYKKGKRIGIWRYFDENGKEIDSKVYSEE